jgi:hypothetical protein
MKDKSTNPAAFRAKPSWMERSKLSYVPVTPAILSPVGFGTDKMGSYFRIAVYNLSAR